MSNMYRPCQAQVHLNCTFPYITGEDHMVAVTLPVHFFNAVRQVLNRYLKALSHSVCAYMYLIMHIAVFLFKKKKN